MTNFYKRIRDGPGQEVVSSRHDFESLTPRRRSRSAYTTLEVVRPAIPRMGLVWMHPGYRETEIGGNGLSCPGTGRLS